MPIQTIAHYVFPAAIRDVGIGLYHLAKRDATEEQCQKLMAGIIRVSAAALFIFSTIALKTFLPVSIAVVIGVALAVCTTAADFETAGLATHTFSGLITARTISLLAKATFGEAVFHVLDTLYGVAITWFVSRIPRDIKVDLTNSFYCRQLLTHNIDHLAEKWGTSLYYATNKTIFTHALYIQE